MEEKKITLESVFGEMADNNKFEEITVYEDESLVRGLDSIKDKIKAIHDASEDIKIADASKHIKIIADDEKYLKMELTDGRTLDLSSDGLQSLSSSFNLSAGYVRKCLEEGMQDLAADNMNRWIEKAEGKGRLLRITENRVQAVLSERYSIFDDIDLMQTIDPIFNNLGRNFSVKNYTVNAGIMKLRIVSDEKFMVGEDELSLGIDIKNSRIGKSSIDLSFMMFRWACSNGMIFGRKDIDSFRKIHSGEVSLLSSGLTELIESVPSKVNDAITSGNEVFSRMLDYKDIRNLNSVMKADSLPKPLRVEFSERFLDDVNFGPARAWDAINFLTHASKIYGVGTREKIEKAAGMIYSK